MGLETSINPFLKCPNSFGVNECEGKAKKNDSNDTRIDLIKLF